MGIRNPLRHQLASTSPVTMKSLFAAVRTIAAVGDEEPLTALEALLRGEYGVAGVVLCGSGTQALTLAMEAGKRLLGKQATVVLPAFSCFDVASAAIRFGRPVRFYDVSPKTLGPDLESLEEALAFEGHNNTILVVASLFGIPLDWDALDPITARSGTVVVEDAAQGHGARWKGSRLGGHGRLGVLSFSRGKGWTGGAGGALLVRDEEDRSRLSLDCLPLSSGTGDATVVARAGAQWLLGRPGLYGVPRSMPGLNLGETTYRPAPVPSVMPAAAARLVLGSHAAADAQVPVRRRIAIEYAEHLEREGIGETCVVLEGGEPGYIRFPVLLQDGMASFKVTRTARKLGAEASYPKPLPFLAEMGRLLETGPHTRQTRAWPGSSTLSRQLVTLPTHGLMRDEERRQLMDLLSGRDG